MRTNIDDADYCLEQKCQPYILLTYQFIPLGMSYQSL